MLRDCTDNSAAEAIAGVTKRADPQPLHSWLLLARAQIYPSPPAVPARSGLEVTQETPPGASTMRAHRPRQVAHGASPVEQIGIGDITLCRRRGSRIFPPAGIVRTTRSF